MQTPTPRPQAPATERHPLITGPSSAQIQDLEESGFLQISGATLPPVEEPFPIRVSVPMLFRDGHPFYLYITNEDGSLAFLVTNPDVVDTFLIEMALYTPFDDMLGYPTAYFWAEMLEDGEMNFDTRTPCPDFHW